ncbi:MAG: AraC family transcriptional regulator [Tidjanibacter sp.]|nr:AraC family transcriptional regulator [Tidjanibacter sp.]
MSKAQIDYLQWRNRLDEVSDKNMRIGTDIFLVRDEIKTLKDRPFKVDVTTCIIYIRGWVHFRINMKEYRAEAPCMIIMPYNAIIETIEKSEDLVTRTVVMSRSFTDSLFSTQANVSPLQKHITDNPILDLKGEEEGLIRYYSMLKDLVCRSQSPYRLEAAKHLTLALFYSYTGQKHAETIKDADALATKRERKDEIYEQFIELLQQNYKREREVGFYAEQMCLTPKYLSKAIKEATGTSATEWIERYVTTESKALLYSTDQTIQQISDALGFESQSLFGKYFKRVVGVSPRTFRQQIKRGEN